MSYSPEFAGTHNLPDPRERHPKDTDIQETIAEVVRTVEALRIVIANKQTYRVGDQPTLHYLQGLAEALTVVARQAQQIPG